LGDLQRPYEVKVGNASFVSLDIVNNQLNLTLDPKPSIGTYKVDIYFNDSWDQVEVPGTVNIIIDNCPYYSDSSLLFITINCCSMQPLTLPSPEDN
jgi:hypothetical protein